MAFKELMVYAMIFLVCTNAIATAFVASGTASAWGIGPPIPDDEIDDIQDSRNVFNASELQGSSIPGYDIVNIIFGFKDQLIEGAKLLTVGGPTLLNWVLPDWMVALIFGPMYLIVIFGIIEWVLGR